MRKAIDRSREDWNVYVPALPLTRENVGKLTCDLVLVDRLTKDIYIEATSFSLLEKASRVAIESLREDGMRLEEAENKVNSGLSLLRLKSVVELAKQRDKDGE